MPGPNKVLPEIYVQPGESYMISEPAILRTVLGSCVGITFLVPRLSIGALCHPMLPSYPAKRSACRTVANGRRYVDFCIQDMARQIDSLGAARSEVQVKLFGGADVLPISGHSMQLTVGEQNCDAAFRVLCEEGFGVAASSLGGTFGVNILFHTGTGEVRLRRLS